MAIPRWWTSISRTKEGDVTAGEPLIAHASRYIHSLLRRSPSYSRLARGIARCLRLASAFASRVRVLAVAFGLAGVCARVGRLGRWRHLSRTRYLRARACPLVRSRETIINKVYYASSHPRFVSAPTTLYLFRRRDTRHTRVSHIARGSDVLLFFFFFIFLFFTKNRANCALC